MDKRKSRLDRGVVIALDITDIAGFRKFVSLREELDVLILLEEVIAVATTYVQNVDITQVKFNI